MNSIPIDFQYHLSLATIQVVGKSLVEQTILAYNTDFDCLNPRDP